MTKNKTGIIIAVAVIAALIWATVICVFVLKFVQKQTGAYTEALNKTWSAYSSDADGELYKALCETTEARVKGIQKNSEKTTLTVEVDTLDLGNAVKGYREKNDKFMPAQEMTKKQLELLDSAVNVKKTFSLNAKGDKSNPEIELTNEFINAMLGYVYTDEEVSAEGFADTAISGFSKAVDINGKIDIDYKKLDSIIKCATSIHRYENKIYYASYHLNNKYDDSEYYTRKLKCYNMETGQDDTLYSYDCYWHEYGSSNTLIACLSDGVVIAKEERYYGDDDEDYTNESFVYDYKEEKSKKIKIENAISVYEAAVIMDYKDGVIYYTIGQDGFGDIYKFAVDDDVESIAVDFEKDYVYMQNIKVNSGNIIFDMMDMDEYEASNYENMNYAIYANNGTSVGEKLVSDFDGGFGTDDNGDLYFFRGTKLIKYSLSEKKETEIVDTKLTNHSLSVRYVTDEFAYIVGYKEVNEDEYYSMKPFLYKVNLSTGEKENFKNVPDNVMYGY